MSDEKTEQPTESKLKDAQGKGQVLKSAELQQALTLSVGLAGLAASGPWIVDSLLVYFRQSLHGLALGGDFDLTNPSWLTGLLKLTLLAFVPLLLCSGTIGALLAIGLSKGRMKTNLMPEDLSRFNMVSNAQRWFSRQTVAELVRLTLKFGLLWHATVTTYEMLGPPVYSLRLTQVYQAQAAAEAVTSLLNRFIGLALLVGGFDLLYQRWDYIKGLMMTKTEVKDEYKKSEGDPMVKWRRRSFGRKLIKKSGINRLSEAAVVITNPTHYAVALKFDATMIAPQVICKGVDALALEIRQRATVMGHPIVEDKPLARALYKVELDTYIPEELFEAAARVLLAVRTAESYTR